MTEQMIQPPASPQGGGDNRGAEIRAGVFVMAALLVLVFLYFYGTDITAMFRPHGQFLVLLEQAGGLQKGSAVRVAGVAIGKVTDIRIVEAETHGVEAIIHVSTDIPLRVGTRAFVRSTEFVIGKYVELHGGPADGPLMKDGDRIPGIIEPSINEIMGSAGVIILKVKDLMDDVNTIFTENRLERLVENTTRIAEIAGTPEDNLLHNVREAIKNLVESGVTEDVTELLNILGESKEELVALITRGSQLTMDSNQLIIDHQKDIAELIVYWSRISKTLADQIDPITQDMRTLSEHARQASENLPAITEEVRDMLPTLNRTLVSLNTILAKLEKIDETDIRRFLQHEGIRAYLLKTQAPPLPEERSNTR